MENLVEIESQYRSLDYLCSFLKRTSNYKCEKVYDIWEVRSNENGQMEQCLILEKSAMHALKIFFVNKSTVKINHIIPNKLMNAYFGKSVKARRNIIEVIAGFIKQGLLSGSQKKAFEELEAIVAKAAV